MIALRVIASSVRIVTWKFYDCLDFWRNPKLYRLTKTPVQFNSAIN